MATKAQTNGLSPGKPVFRRQGSSIQGNHPLAVVLSSPHIDYSVTKGGARTWVVLLVFGLLCTSIYTLFSTEGGGGRQADLDGDADAGASYAERHAAAARLKMAQQVDDDNDDNDGEEEGDARHADRRERRAPPQQAPPSGNSRKSSSRNTKEHDDDDAQPAASEQPDDDDNNEGVEESMLARLRRKMEQKLQEMSKAAGIGEEKPEQRRAKRHRRKKQVQEEAEEEEEVEEKAQDESKRSKNAEKEKKVKAEEDEKEDEEEQKEEEEPPKRQLKKLRQKRPKNQRQREEVEQEEEEKEEEEENDKEEDNDDDDQDKKDDDDNGDDKEVEEREKTDEENMGRKVEIPSAAEDEEDEKEEEEESLTQKQKKRRRKVLANALPATEQSFPCTRKHCPPEYAATPRKNILKKKKKQPQQLQGYGIDTDDEEEGEREDEDGEEKEEETDVAASPTPRAEPVAEIIALRKHRASGREAYKRHAITSRDDHRIRQQLDEADRLLDKHDISGALSALRRLLAVHPRSPRALFGLARAHDALAEDEDDDDDVDEAINYYQEVVDEEMTPDLLFRQAAERLADRARFRSRLHTTLAAQRSLIDRFPEEMKLQTDMALTFLAMGRLDDSRKILNNVLDVDGANGYALAYRGLLDKLEGDLDGGVGEMRRGLRILASGGEELADARLFHHLGDGLLQLGRRAEAYDVFEKGASLGLFLSAFQRSTHNIDALRAQPWWTIEQCGYLKQLRSIERQWVSMRHEAASLLESDPSAFRPVMRPASLKASDERIQEFVLFEDAVRHSSHCKAAPMTCEILDDLARTSAAALKSESSTAATPRSTPKSKRAAPSKKSQKETRSNYLDPVVQQNIVPAKKMSFSLLRAGTRIPPHCGPSNTRLVAELGLIVPSEARIRVGHETRGWKLGHFIVYDDSFEHELWMEGASASSYRLVLSIDLWHPDVPAHLRTSDDDSDEM